MNYSIKSFDQVIQEWDDFVLNSSTGWFWHTTHYINYIINSRYDCKSENVSFIVYCDNKIIAVVPLVKQTIYKAENLFEFGMLDSNIPFPVINNLQHKDNLKDVLKIIFEEIDRIAQTNNITYSRFYLPCLSEEILIKEQNFNPLSKLSFNDTSITSNIINLLKSEEELFSRIRKGHKADIKTAIKNDITIEIYTKDNITLEIFNIYRKLHFLDAGRQTRADKSWEFMYEWIKTGNAILALEKKENIYISSALIITYKSKAYYGSAGTHPEHDGERGIGHIIQWEIIKYLKSQGFCYYEIGWNFYRNISQEVASGKEINISHFKAGFGGDIFPLFRGEKFYNNDYFKKIYNDRFIKFTTY